MASWNGDYRIITGAESAAWTPEEKAEMLDWLRANGVTPEDVWAQAGTHDEDNTVIKPDVGFAVGRGEIVYEHYVRNEAGYVQLKLAAQLPVTEQRIMPILVPFPKWSPS